MAVACPRCASPYPPLDGVDDYALLEVAELVHEGDLDGAARRLMELAHLGPVEATRFVSCPHGAVSCPSCRGALPAIGGDPARLAEVAGHIAGRRLIEAIKLVRELTGAGLREAKEYVDCPHRPLAGREPAPIASSHVGRVGSPGLACPLCARPLPPIPGATRADFAEIAGQLARGNKIAAIKHVRQISGWGLRESKDYADCPHRAP
jgi:ribosomal protein L7/L12